jgi:hypothetical protein
MCVMLVVESKNLPPSYAESTRRVVVNHKNWKRIFALALTFVAIVALTSVAPAARLDDEHEAKVKDAAAQSAKAAKAFDAIMKIPDKAIPRTYWRMRKPSRFSLKSSRRPLLWAAKAGAAS